MKRCINSGRNKKIRPGSKHSTTFQFNSIRTRRWEHTLSQVSYPALMSVLLTLQVATSGCVIIRRAWGECKVKFVLLRRRCSLEGKIWWLDKCNFIIENQVEQVFTSRDSLLGEPMFKVEYDDAKKEMQKENKTKAERKTQHNTSGKLFNGAHRRAEALVEIQVFDFFILFF
jgi:hypothetical protein